MEKFIPETYKEVTSRLEPVMEKYDLDKITVESLVRSSIEIEEQVAQPATAVWKSKSGKIYSTKGSNIKVNLKFALSSVFRLKTTLGQKDFWLGFAIIYLIVDLFTMATEEIDEISSVVLIAVYRLQHGDEKRLREYINHICPSNLEKDITQERIEESLKQLESWGCISCIDGIYTINEIVTASMVKSLA
nr:hypothetical protein [uncultured Blautia sp.]